MKKFSFYLPPAGYVSKPAELLVLFVIMLVLIGVVVFTWNGIVDVPPLPKHMVLRSAHVTQPFNMSKGKADLYFEVDSDKGGYKGRLELMRRDVEFLHVFKGKKIWVAVEAESDNSFVWGVYDDSDTLMIGREQIERGRRTINESNYFAVFWFSFCIVYCLYFLVRDRWNSYFYRKDG